MITSANEILFRCSSLGKLMGEPKDKKETVSQGTKTHLIDVFVSAVYGRREDAHGKAIEKGNDREEDSITLLSRHAKIAFNKNKTELNNAYIKGTPDIFTGPEITKADYIYDTKTPWSAFTFLRNKVSGLEKDYWWQIMGYIALTGAKAGAIAFCLVNSTAKLIMEEKRKAAYRFGIDPESDPEYIAECRQIEVNHIFDMQAFRKENPGFDFHSDLSEWNRDIAREDRLLLFEVQRDEEAIQRLYKRIEDCRAWMNANLFKPAA